MSSNISNNSPELSRLLDRMSVKKHDDVKAEQSERKQVLGQILDPFAPMENGEFIAQMAQFSTVSGIGEINSSLSNLVQQLDQNRIATATSYVGKSVLVPGGVATPDENGKITGAIDLPDNVAGLGLTITDSSGTTVQTLNLGPQGKGLVGFEWDGLDDVGEVAGMPPYQISANALILGKAKTLPTNVFGKVETVNLPNDGGRMTLDVSGVGTVEVSDVKKVRD